MGEEDLPLVFPERGFFTGISPWVDDDFKRPAGALRKGPVSNYSKPPPTITYGRSGVKRGPGRLPMAHHFLDAVKASFRSACRRRRPAPMCRDRLKEFREQVWFLILANYSPSSIESIFKRELPILFPQLSYDGVVYSVSAARTQAKAGKLILEGDFAELLQAYNSGPWASDAPMWLREQYAVEPVEPVDEKEAKRVAAREMVEDGVPELPSGLSARGQAAGPVSVDVLRREFETAKAFFRAWDSMKRRVPDLEDATLEELGIGISEGFEAVIAGRLSRHSGKGLAGVAVIPGESGLGLNDRLKMLAVEIVEVEALLGEPLSLTGSEKIQATAIGLHGDQAREHCKNSLQTMIFRACTPYLVVTSSPDAPQS